MNRQTNGQRMWRRVWHGLAGLAVLWGVGSAGSGALAKEPVWQVFDAPTLPVVTLQAGMYRIDAEVAATPAARQTGLMHRPALAGFAGMLFVFPDEAVHCFWMKDTQIPLSVAFIDARGEIVSIANMEPFSLDSHCPDKPVRYALELNRGWFAAHGVGAGDSIGGLDAVPPAR